MEHVPRCVQGLEIEDGPRNKASIIRDMVPIMCNGQMLFNRMQSQDPSLKKGKVVYRVVVESTGEVASVDVVETTIYSDRFVRKIADMIMDTDFVNWTPDDTDAIFHYPARFSD